MSTIEVAPVSPPPETAPSQSKSAEQRQTLWYSILLGAGTLALYATSLRNDFIYFDDPVYVIDNPLINQGLVWRHVVSSFNSLITGEWHPLALISHMLDVQLFGLHPAGHHLVSALWHAFNVVLCFIVLKRATGFTKRSAMVAGLFATLPLNVETVAWIAERKSLISTAFMLLALLAYGWYVRKPGVGRYLTVMLMFALGLMAKSMIVTLPCVLLLVDYWPLRRLDLPEPNTALGPWAARLGKLCLEKAPLLLLSAASSWATVRGMRMYGALVSVDFYPFSWRLKTTIYSYLMYIVKGLWPTRLAVFYPYEARTLAVWKVVAAGLVLAAITAAVCHFREKRYLVTGWFWYLGTIVPVIGIVQVGHQSMADRYAYVPFLGLFVMAVWLIGDLAIKAQISRTAIVALASAVLAGYGISTYAQIGYWRNTYTLYAHAVSVTSQNATIEENLAGLLVEQGHPELANQHYEAAVRYLPRWSAAHFDYGHLLQQQGRFPEAIQQYQLALAYETSRDEACATHTNLGAIFVQENRIDQALAEFNAAVQIRPENGLARLNRGLIEYSQGNLDAATGDFSQAVKFLPEAKSYFWLGRALQDKGEFGAAAQAFESTLKADPTMKDAQADLDLVRHQLQGTPSTR